jgi:4'-phosphopantetheinyl transferase
MMDWIAAPASASLEVGDVHVWRINLDRDQAGVQRLRALLSGDELDRAARFHFEADRRRHIVSHGASRSILGHYLGRPAARIGFKYSDYGKPDLDHDTDIAFNLAHSGMIALIAVTRGVLVGVDVELVRPDIDLVEIAERYFSPRENRVLRSLPPEQQCQCFFDCWTRKEAYIKALGAGLSIPLDRFDVANAPGEPARLIEDRLDPMMSRRWVIKELPVPEGYVAAAAVETAVIKWSLFDWDAARKDQPG